MLVSNKVISNSGVRFGTSGARGLVEQFTPEVCAAFASAFIGSIKQRFDFQSVAVAIDNRPSSSAMAQATIAAIESMGLTAIYFGVVPTPALAYAAMQNNIPCIMITGSHIPFDRNGIKFYRPDGEISKVDEQAILNAEERFSIPDPLPELIINSTAAKKYKERYISLFNEDLLLGKRIGIYEHSSAGRDLYANLFESLGADVISLERTNEFVPIDTEAVAESDKEKAKKWSKEYNLDFIFSTDGDGDRPLVANEYGEWLRGDILGLLCAQAMEVESLAIPVSCNSIISESKSFKSVIQTKIGSPYVIAEFAALAKKYGSVAGFEANGGFLLGSDIEINGKTLKALPTRDAVLPALMLFSASKDTSIGDLLKVLPNRFTHSDRIKNFATEKSLAILSAAKENPDELIEKLNIKNVSIESVNKTDGLRLTLSNNTIIHLRPSGNAPELRCYSEADTFDKARELVNNVLSQVVYL